MFSIQEFLIASLLFLLQIADWFSTKIISEKTKVVEFEMNPIVRSMLRRTGMNAQLFLIKAVAGVMAAGVFLAVRGAQKSPAGFTGLKAAEELFLGFALWMMTYVVLGNACQIARVYYLKYWNITAARPERMTTEDFMRLYAAAASRELNNALFFLCLGGWLLWKIGTYAVIGMALANLVLYIFAIASFHEYRLRWREEQALQAQPKKEQ